MNASQRGRVPVVELLLKHHARVDLRAKVSTSIDLDLFCLACGGAELRGTGWHDCVDDRGPVRAVRGGDGVVATQSARELGRPGRQCRSPAFQVASDDGLLLLCLVGSVDGLGLRDAEEFRRRCRAFDRRSDRCGFPGYGREFPVLCAMPVRVANRVGVSRVHSLALSETIVTFD